MQHINISFLIFKLDYYVHDKLKEKLPQSSKSFKLKIKMSLKIKNYETGN